MQDRHMGEYETADIVRRIDLMRTSWIQYFGITKITNSAHVLFSHLPRYLRLYGTTLVEFSQQGPENCVQRIREIMTTKLKNNADQAIPGGLTVIGRTMLNIQFLIAQEAKRKPCQCGSITHCRITSSECPLNKSELVDIDEADEADEAATDLVRDLLESDELLDHDSANSSSISSSSANSNHGSLCGQKRKRDAIE